MSLENSANNAEGKVVNQVALGSVCLITVTLSAQQFPSPT